MLKRIKKLCTIQLMNFLKKNSENNVKKSISLHIFKVFGFANFYYVFFFIVDNTLRIPLSINLLSSILFAIGIMITISGIKNLAESLYVGNDNSILLPLPVNANEVFFSKIIVEYIHEVISVSLFILPMFIGFGLRGRVDFIYYVLSILITFLFPLFTTLISSLLSIPYMFIKIVINKKTILKFSFYMILTFIGGLIIYKVVNAMPNRINLLAMYNKFYQGISVFLEQTANKSLIFNWFAKLAFLEGAMLNSMFIAVALLIAILSTYFISKPVYFYLITRSLSLNSNLEYSDKNEYNSNVLITFIKKELRHLTRNANSMFHHFSGLIMLPVVVYAFVKFLAAFNTSIRGDRMIISLFFLIAGIFSLSSNVYAASALSREGDVFYLNKICPAESYKIALAKLYVNLGLSSISIVLTAVSCIILLDIDSLIIINIFIVILIINIGHIFWSLEMDLLNPQFSIYKDGNESRNPNVSRSLTIGFIISIIFFFILFINVFGRAEMFGTVILYASVFAMIRIILFLSKLKIYFEEL